MASLADRARAREEQDDALDHLRAANARLSRQLAEAKANRAELVAAVRQAAFDAATGLVIPPVPKPPADRRSNGAETAVAVVSDLQLAKITPTYSTEVCEERMERYADKVLEMTRIQRQDHPVPECRVYLLGDVVEGEMIFPGQSFRIDASLYRQVVVDGPRILSNLVRRLAGTFSRVHVVGVIGNHGAIGGRSRKDMHPESNADAMAYEVARHLVAGEKRISWAPNFTPGERHWYAVDYVYDWGFLLIHGDQVRGFNGVPWYGFDRRIKGWRLNSVPLPFDYVLSGHFHTPMEEYINGIVHFGNGSTESDNTYAAESLAASGEPNQLLLFVHPTIGVSAKYTLWLEPRTPTRLRYIHSPVNAGPDRIKRSIARPRARRYVDSTVV